MTILGVSVGTLLKLNSQEVFLHLKLFDTLIYPRNKTIWNGCYKRAPWMTLIKLQKLKMWPQ